MNETYGMLSGIEEKLNSILKSDKPTKIEDEKEKDEMDLYLEDDEDFLVPETEEEDTEEETEPEEIKEEDSEEEEDEQEVKKEVKKSVEDTEAIDTEDEQEDEQEDEKTLELDEVVTIVKNRIMEDVKEEINGLKTTVDKVVELLGKNTDALSMVSPNKEVEKSLKDIEDKLDTFSKALTMKKSVTNVNVMEKFQPEDRSINDLSKSQIASILADEFEAGNRKVTSTDITNAELGNVISKSAIEVIKKHLG